MATTNNIILQNAKGSIGKTIVVKKYGNKTVISKYPDMSGVKYNDLQKQEQSRFAEVYNAALKKFLKRDTSA